MNTLQIELSAICAYLAMYGHSIMTAPTSLIAEARAAIKKS